jgi:hypothetical protein
VAAAISISAHAAWPRSGAADADDAGHEALGDLLSTDAIAEGLQFADRFDECLGI